MLWTNKMGATLSFEFSGTAVGTFILAGPDAGIIEVSIDGSPFVKYDLYHEKYSKNLHYPRVIMFSNDLSSGKHQLILRMLKETSSKGNAMRIIGFVVN